MTYQDLRNLTLSLLEENTLTPVRWNEDQIEFFINAGIEHLSDFYSGWISETSGAQITTGSDVYAISDNVARVNEVKLKLTTQADYSTVDSLEEFSLAYLPIDGKVGQPTKYAVKDSASVSNPNLIGVVFYPYPDATYDIRISYNYNPRMVQSAKTAVVPIPTKFETALVYLICARLMTKVTVNKKGQKDSAYYEGVAMQSLSMGMKNDVNRQAYNSRGYFSKVRTGAFPLDN